jgi:hypothetical protein
MISPPDTHPFTLRSFHPKRGAMDPTATPASAAEKSQPRIPLRVQLVARDEALQETKLLKRWDDGDDIPQKP